jgi:hypothetical protein
VQQGIGECLAGGVAGGRRLGQGPGDRLIDARRQARPPGGHPRRRVGQVRVHHRGGFLAPERRRAGQQLERRAGQPVLIGPPVRRPALDLLGRDVVQRAQELARPGQPGRGSQGLLAQPEIGQVHVV